MYYIWMVGLGLVLGVIVAIFDLPMWAGWAVAIAVVFVVMGNQLYIMVKSQNLQKITKFVDRSKRQPVYHHLHTLRDGTDAEVIASLERILKKHKQPLYQATYGASRAALLGDYEAARKAVAPVEDKEVGRYTRALVDILAGEDVRIDGLKPWMQASLEAHQAFMRRDREAFDEAKARAIALAGGIQYYSNYYSFKRLEAKW